MQPIHDITITIKGLISTQLLQSLQTQDIQYKAAAETITQILLKISIETYDQIWKPYCERFAEWKKQHGIPTHNTVNTTQTSTYRCNQSQCRKFTYSCSCGLADQLHDENRNCSPKGQAVQKVQLWSTL